MITVLSKILKISNEATFVNANFLGKSVKDHSAEVHWCSIDVHALLSVLQLLPIANLDVMAAFSLLFTCLIPACRIVSARCTNFRCTTCRDLVPVASVCTAVGASNVVRAVECQDKTRLKALNCWSEIHERYLPIFLRHLLQVHFPVLLTPCNIVWWSGDYFQIKSFCLSICLLVVCHT